MESLEDRTVPSFVYPAQYLSNPANPYYTDPVAAGDFNGDGQLDLAVDGQGGRDAYLGNGDGTFQSAITSPSAGGSYWYGRLRAADFNGDGRDDLVASNGSVSLSNGDGTFQTSLRYSGTDVAAGDLDGNGTIDLVYSGYGSDPYYGALYGSVTVFKGNGDGTFTHSETYSVGAAPTSVALADFNNDGALDIAVGDSGYTGYFGAGTYVAAAILMGHGNGTFANAEDIFSDYWDHYSEPGARVTAADFNRDGHIDLAVSGGYPSTQILLGNGDGSFQIGQTVATRGSAMTVAEFNGDGIPDVVTGFWSRDDLKWVRVALGNGDGTFAEPLQFAVDLPWMFEAADLNGDGLADLYGNSMESGPNRVVVLMNDGNWPTPGQPPVFASVGDVSVVEGNVGTVSATFTVTLSSASAQTVTIDYATADGTAGGSDYTAASGTLTFAPGETAKTITVLVKGDRLHEPNETFVVNLSNASNAILTDGQGVGTIIDNEPRISISDESKLEGKKGTTTITFTVSLLMSYDQPVTMSFRTADGSAKASNKDYAAKSGTITFAPGETTKTITIEVTGDNKYEYDETFYIDLFGNSSNSVFTKNRGIGTILTDDFG